jgi:hypothetical protein
VTPRAPARRGPWESWPAWARIALAAALVIGLAATLLSRDGDDQGRRATTTIPPASQDYAMGTTARTAAFDVIVHGFTDPQPPGAFLRPTAGTHYVSVDVQVVNRGTTTQTFSSLIQIHLLDRTNRQFEPTFGDLEPPAPDGDIPPGAASRGQALFEVPDGASGLRVRVQGDLSTPGVVFALG